MKAPLKLLYNNDTTNTAGIYVAGGGDMVQVLVDACRQRGMSPFVSLRPVRRHDQNAERIVDGLNELCIVATGQPCEVICIDWMV
jgi:hypothetical protein